MQRRQVLGAVGSLGLAALAGCLQGDPGGDGDEPTDSPTESPTASPTPTPSPTETSTLTDATFEMTAIGGGTAVQEAAVEWDDAVVVTGTTTGNNGCYVAELGSTEYAPRTLTVTVAAKEREDAESCTQALVTIDYEATFSFEGALPDTVVVNHDSMGETTTVTTAHRPG